MQTDNERYNDAVKPNTAFLNELKTKLPNFFSKDGEFDLDKFKSQLREYDIDELKDGYQLNFIGKDYARRQAGEMTSTVIVPDEEQNNGEGKNSKNLFFTGDNLEVLRHLQTSYTNKIDIIYIDPPYNTGSDGFVYPDKFEHSDDKLKEMFGMDDDQVRRLKSIQGKSSHSAWLTFMYPRIFLSKKLLSDKGAIFISIDDNEVKNLRNICDEIYGENNFVAQVSVQLNPRGRNLDVFVAKTIEYVLIYVKNYSNPLSINPVEKTGKMVSEYNKEDDAGKYREIGLRNRNQAFNPETRPNLYYPLFVNPKTRMVSIEQDSSYTDEVWPDAPDGTKTCWTWMKDKSNKQKDLLIAGKSGNKWRIYRKDYLVKNGKKATTLVKTLWTDKEINNDYGKKSIKQLFGSNVMTFPKSPGLMKKIIEMGSQKDSIVLDFFAGSATTADAVMQLNAEDDGHRKFIMVQLPEKTYHINKDGKEVPTKGGKAAYDAGFKSIDQISRERIRRASEKIKENAGLALPVNFDGSFKHYRVVSPTKQALESIEDFDPNNTSLFTDMVESFSSKKLEVSGNATGEETILTTWLAKDGYSFEADIKKVDFAGYEASLVEDSRLYIIKDGWTSENTKDLLNKVGTHQLIVQTIVLFGYSFNIADLRELEIGLKQLDGSINLLKRY
ncbi:DNA methylase [Ligilactobacillus hayakitensis DSM 18933 = JCM 14209]|uniref:DNA methylase n=1 Tax=Ligilactobacillus hayakitensis DSM 18933 = JCM 14209 TaxID=1423755 RepID=A0A0R1X1W1_9LACO|nr:site-specific DNA-methyltransferase [Ligilactobacillus hayakitensis]KRM20380.1 DNA methylase [Ligilactobacillus hayakitensis DSM 18933 = JCM 14209]